MRARTLAEAMGCCLSLTAYRLLRRPFNRAMFEAGVTTEARAAMWCAMLGEESHGLEWLVELGSGWEYEGRPDLGNTLAGDGPRFKGRGPIQITGRNNYTHLSEWAYEHGHVPTPTYFLDHPDRLSWRKYVFLGPVWYWTVARPQLNALADAGDLNGATLAINGGLNGLDDRRARYEHCLSLGAALLPSRPPKPTVKHHRGKHRRNPHKHPAARHLRYIVCLDDTLAGIAKAHGTTWHHLMVLNRLPDPNRIYVGQILVV